MKRTLKRIRPARHPRLRRLVRLRPQLPGRDEGHRRRPAEGASSTPAQAAEVKKLRADGEKLHKDGKHAESMAALGKAKGILGIK